MGLASEKGESILLDVNLVPNNILGMSVHLLHTLSMEGNSCYPPTNCTRWYLQIPSGTISGETLTPSMPIPGGAETLSSLRASSRILLTLGIHSMGLKETFKLSCVGIVGAFNQI
jgi:hypothetical protein